MLKMIFCCEKTTKIIGSNGELPWHYKIDMLFFKEITTDAYVICGRKTYDTLPKLKHRKIIVISTGEVTPNERNPIYACYNNVEEIAKIAVESNEFYFVIGGASIYEAFKDYVEELIVTEISPCEGYHYLGDTIVFDYDTEFKFEYFMHKCIEEDLKNKGVVSVLCFSKWTRK